MPWKVNGENWHLGEKGFPPGRKMNWDRSILPTFFRSPAKRCLGWRVQWDARDAITLRVPGRE